MKKLVVLFLLFAAVTIGLAIAATVQKTQGFPKAMDSLSIILLFMTGIAFGLIAFFLAAAEKKMNKIVEKNFQNPIN